MRLASVLPFSPALRSSARSARSLALPLSVIAAALLASAGGVRANVVTFDVVPPGPWGGAFGNAPGDFIFDEDDITVHVQEFKLGAFTGFIQAEVVAAIPDFGSGRIMSVNNINLQFRFGAVPNAPCSVQFLFFDQGGAENLQVNFGTLWEVADLADLHGVVVAPGVTCYVSTIVTGSGVAGVCVLDGPVNDLWVGGQEFFLDDVRTVCPTDKDCHHQVTYETRPVGECFGPCGGDALGDVVFVEDGIPVHVFEFDSGGPVFFNQAHIDVAFVGFGKSHIMRFNNIDQSYDLAALPCDVETVTFRFADLGGTENLQVNAGPLHVGDMAAMPAVPAPNTSFSVVTSPLPGGIRGEVTIKADPGFSIGRVRIGGQEFWVDNLCATCAAPVSVPSPDEQASRLRLAPLANPFRTGTSLRYDVPSDGTVRLHVFDVSGARVATLVDGVVPAGEHLVPWSGVDRAGRPLPAGTYFLRLESSGGATSSKIVMSR